MKEKNRSFQDVKCPICGGEVNRLWFKETVTAEDYMIYARFICECWSGDLTNNKPHHIFLLDYLMDGETTYPKVINK